MQEEGTNAEMPEFNIDHVQVFMDISIGDREKGRIVIELFQDMLPKTVENFRALCTGELGLNMHYKHRNFPRVIPNFMMQGGKIVPNNEPGFPLSTFGPKFADEGVWIPHTHKGIVSMANAGPDTNGSSFFIIYGPADHLDGKHSVIGRVIHGYSICEKVEKMSDRQRELMPIVIANAGELKQEEKMQADQCDWLETYKK